MTDILKEDTYTFDPADYEDYLMADLEISKRDAESPEQLIGWLEHDYTMLIRVLQLLTAAGHVSQKKLDQAINLADSLK